GRELVPARRPGHRVVAAGTATHGPARATDGLDLESTEHDGAELAVGRAVRGLARFVPLETGIGRVRVLDPGVHVLAHQGARLDVPDAAAAHTGVGVGERFGDQP